MKVYVIRREPDDYWFLSSDTFKFEDTNDPVPYGKRIASRWKPTNDYYVQNPLVSQGDFFSLDATLMPVMEKSGRADKTVGRLIKDCAELLPFSFGGRTMYAINVLAQNDCLDYKKTEFKYLDESRSLDAIHGIKKIAFDKENMPHCSLFRLPRYDEIEVFSYEGVKQNPEEEFKYLYDKHNLTGLEFRLVWDSEADEV